MCDEPCAEGTHATAVEARSTHLIVRNLGPAEQIKNHEAAIPDNLHLACLYSTMAERRGAG